MWVSFQRGSKGRVELRPVGLCQFPWYLWLKVEADKSCQSFYLEESSHTCRLNCMKVFSFSLLWDGGADPTLTAEIALTMWWMSGHKHPTHRVCAAEWCIVQTLPGLFFKATDRDGYCQTLRATNWPTVAGDLAADRIIRPFWNEVGQRKGEPYLSSSWGSHLAAKRTKFQGVTNYFSGLMEDVQP